MDRRTSHDRRALLICAGLVLAVVAPVAISHIYYAGAGERTVAPVATIASGLEAKAPAARAAARTSRARFAPRAPMSTRGFSWPVDGSHLITSPFGPRDDDFHHGADIACAEGQPVYSARAGMVRHAGDGGAYGLAVLIDHGGGFQTLYAHFSRLDVKPGTYVGTRQMMGTCGATGKATGPHLHFEVRYRGYVYDPVTFLP